MSVPRTHAEHEELLGAYALDALDGEEREAVEVHLRGCPWCRDEVAQHREVAALISQGGGLAPENVWDRIVEALEPAPPRMRVEVDDGGRSTVVPLAGRERSAADGPAPMAPAGTDRSGRRIGRGMLALVAVAAVVVAAMGVVIVRLDSRVRTVEGERAGTLLSDAASAAWVDPKARKAELKPLDGSIAVPVAITADGAGYVLAGGVPDLPAGLTYQLWGSVGAQTISLGTFDGGTEVVPFRVDPAVKRLLVTTERRGGVVKPQLPPTLAALI